MTQGSKIGQVSLRFGGDDFGWIMIEENVVSAAGAHNRMTEDEMRRIIRDAGYTPVQRRTLYDAARTLLHRPDSAAEAARRPPGPSSSDLDSSLASAEGRRQGRWKLAALYGHSSARGARNLPTEGREDASRRGSRSGARDQGARSSPQASRAPVRREAQTPSAAPATC